MATKVTKERKKKAESTSAVLVSKVKPSKAPKLDPVFAAIQALMNTSTLIVEEKKTILSPEAKLYGYDKPIIEGRHAFDTTVLQGIRSLLGQSVYRFRLTRVSSLVSGSGSFKINSSTNLTQFAEGAALAALFDECKMIKGNIRHAGGTLSGLTGFAFVVGFLPSEDTTTPSTTIVSRLPGAKILGTVNTNFGERDYVVNFSVPGRNWGLTADEGVSAPRIVSGMNGTLKWSDVLGTPSSSSSYYAYLEVVSVEFRSRV